jgi:hypothetical protein
VVAAADFDRDGDIDLAVPFRDGGQSFVFYNDGHARFDTRVAFGPDTAAVSAAAVGDLTGDGWPDLVVGDQNVGLFVYLNDGHGMLESALQVELGGIQAPRSLAIADRQSDRDRRDRCNRGHSDCTAHRVATRWRIVYFPGGCRQRPRPTCVAHLE